jgi:DnaJ-class molecular chaperone
MSTNSQLKNYYSILGVPFDASLFEIESAYEKLAAQWHPDKHKQHRKSAEMKFHDIAEAYECLSDRNKRSQYDEMLNKEYSLQDANTTFESFFNEHGIKNEDEEKFFNQNYPNPLSNYYTTLGVQKNATIDQIRDAYRALALKYHPKNTNEADSKKFVEINEAYNALSNEYKRQAYDDLLWKEMVPVRAHNIFEDFFGNRFLNMEEDDIFKPIFHKKWSRDLDRMMIDENDPSITNGETVKTSSVYSCKDGVESKKAVTTKKKIVDGKVNEETTEEYTFPNGEKNVVKTIKGPDGKVDSHKWSLKKGEDMPKELTN